MVLKGIFASRAPLSVSIRNYQQQVGGFCYNYGQRQLKELFQLLKSFVPLRANKLELQPLSVGTNGCVAVYCPGEKREVMSSELCLVEHISQVTC